MKTIINRFYAKDDLDSLGKLDEDFCGRDGYVWFIEQEGTQLWLMENGELTNDPNKCMQFKAKMIAVTEKIRRKIYNGYTVTEHEFTNSNPLTE